MELHGDLFSGPLFWLLNLCYAAAVVAAVRLAPWGWLREAEQLHVFLGCCLTLVLLWHIRGSSHDELSFHFLGVTTCTLMFGWSLGIIASGIAMVGVTINGTAEWHLLAVNALIVGVIPASLTQIARILVFHYLPKNFFVYVLANGFVTSGLAATVSGYLAAGLLIYSGMVSYESLANTILPFFPLIFFPEAFLNGWAIAILVCFRPRWVHTFSDKLYIHGK